MMNFQEAAAKLIAPATSHPEIAGRPAIVQVPPPAQEAPDRVVTFAELQTLAGRVFSKFKREGVGPGDAVLFCAPNSPELLAAIFAAWASGARAVPVDYRLTASEIDNIAGRLQVKMVYCPNATLPGYKALTAESFAAGQGAPAGEMLAGLKPADEGLVILTSGTTGVPKGAVHTLGSLVENFVELAGVFGLKDGCSVLLPLPVSHIFGIAVALAVLTVGGKVIFADFSAASFWPLVLRSEPSIIVGVPTIYGALLHMPRPQASLDFVEHYLSGGAPLPPALSAEFQRAFGKQITQGYGATETKILTINRGGPPESVGRPLPSVKVEIVDEQHRPLPEGEIGEILIAGPSLMNGYLSQPEATSHVLHDGHYHTGDVGRLQDGWVFINGRMKDMIIVAGNKVFPAEVEAVLARHPLAAEVAVVGVPHWKLGQLVKAVIVVPPGEWTERLAAGESSKETRERLHSTFRDYCRENLKRELRPMDWEFRPATEPLPKTHTGKVDKKMLADEELASPPAFIPQ